MKNIEKLKGVTRVEVIDEFGRCLVVQNIGDVELHLQDDGKTLKIWMRRNVVKIKTLCS